jgi:hypothetical protein
MVPSKMPSQPDASTSHPFHTDAEISSLPMLVEVENAFRNKEMVNGSKTITHTWSLAISLLLSIL